nr:protein C3orf33 homolog [Lytechinus pictus]
MASKESSSLQSPLPLTPSSKTCKSPVATQPARLVAMETNEPSSHQPMNIFGQVTDFLDRHLQSLRIGVALIGVTGLVLIGRSIRVMKMFRSVSDIPEEFIRKQMTLRGKVRGHEGHHIMVEHLPIVQGMKGRIKGRQDSLLPVCLAGVNISEAGLTNLVTLTPLDSIIWFRLLAVNEQKQLECIVKRRKNLFSLMVNETLVKQGFAQVKPAHPSIALHPTTVKLIQRLSKAELYAEKKSKGIWAKPPLRERMNERIGEMKDGLKERTVSTLKPLSAGVNAVKSVKARLGALVRWRNKSSKNG